MQQKSRFFCLASIKDEKDFQACRKDKTCCPRPCPKPCSSILLASYLHEELQLSQYILPVLLLSSNYYFYTDLLLLTVAIGGTSLFLAVSSWLDHPHLLSPHTESFFPRLLSWTALQGNSKCHLTCNLYLPGPGLPGCSGTSRKPTLPCLNSHWLGLPRGSKGLVVLIFIV